MKHFLPAAVIFLIAASVCAQSRTTFKNTQEAVRYYEELVGSLIQQVKLMQDDNATLQASVIDLRKQVSLLNTKVQNTDRELEALKKQVAADAETRKAQLRSLADKLSTPPPAAQPRQQDSETLQGEFIEHTVEPGTTLTALSKAYGVTVPDIKRANNLSSDNIRVGQKLLIPVKR